MYAMLTRMELTVLVPLATSIIAAIVAIISAVSARQSAVKVATTNHTIARLDAESEELRTVYKGFCAAIAQPFTSESVSTLVGELEMLRACRAVTTRLDSAAEKVIHICLHDWEQNSKTTTDDPYVNELRAAYRNAQGLLGDLRAKHLADKTRALSPAASFADD